MWGSVRNNIAQKKLKAGETRRENSNKYQRNSSNIFGFRGIRETCMGSKRETDWEAQRSDKKKKNSLDSNMLHEVIFLLGLY